MKICGFTPPKWLLWNTLALFSLNQWFQNIPTSCSYKVIWPNILKRDTITTRHHYSHLDKKLLLIPMSCHFPKHWGFYAILFNVVHFFKACKISVFQTGSDFLKIIQCQGWQIRLFPAQKTNIPNKTQHF